MAGNTPFRRWNARCMRAASRILASCAGRSVSTTRAAGCVGSSRTRSTCSPPSSSSSASTRRRDRRRRAAPHRRHELRVPPPDDAADAPEQHDTQYFEMLGSRGIYHRGWKAVTFKSLGTAPGPTKFDTPFDEDVWELFNVHEDPSETRNLADDEPERVAALVDLWWEQAALYKVLPLSNRILDVMMNPRPRRILQRDQYVYRPFEHARSDERLRERQEPFAPYCRRHRHRRRCGSRRRAPRDGLRPRRLVVPALPGAASLRAQSLRQGDLHGLVRHRRRCRSAHTRVPLHQDRRARAPPPCRATAR